MNATDQLKSHAAPSPDGFDTIPLDVSSVAQWDRRDLAVLLALQRGVDGRLYSPHADLNLHGAMFGGQLIGQAIAAATMEMPEELAVHCVQVNFLSAGRAGAPMRFDVRRLMQGRQFTVQQVLGYQGERTLITANISCHRGEPGPQFQQRMAFEAPVPESLPTLRETLIANADSIPELARKHAGVSPTLDLRPLNPDGFLFSRDPEHATFRYWVRAAHPLPDHRRLHEAALGYLSDYWFPLTGMAPHLELKIGTGLHVASLNHTMWCHRPARADEWLLVDASSSSACNSRTLNSARIYARDGRLIASLAQESLYRGWIERDGEFEPPGIQPVQ